MTVKQADDLRSDVDGQRVLPDDIGAKGARISVKQPSNIIQ